MKWRLVESGFADAATNMAVDEAVMLAHEAGLVPPTLRLYGWKPPGVSVGYFQPVQGQIDVDECRRRGYGLVRRPTGGRAILHDDEVTYCVVIRREMLPCKDGVMASYRYLSRGIESGLRRLGLGATLADKRADSVKSPGPGSAAACFAKTARCDLSLAGRKIVGSAQTRSATTVLQHGSIPLSLNVDDMFAVMRPGQGARPRALAAISLSEGLGRPVTFDEVCKALVVGFQEALGVEIEPGELTPAEVEQAQRLQREKYANDDWNLQVGRRSAAAV